MQDNRPIQLSEIREELYQFHHVMPVDGAEVVEVERGEKRRRRTQEIHRLLFHAFGEFPQARPAFQGAFT